ncbi:MAG: signal peptide peptidase SppA [Elusimicrobiota bacterium]|jgi:protease-4|nr:signal peptide peptidase SppA [Elusimicrobiota bacterium]
MEENNNTNDLPSAQQPQSPHGAQYAGEPETRPEPQDIALAPEENNNKALKIWLFLLTCIFSVSMLSGLYIIFYGVSKQPEAAAVEEGNAINKMWFIPGFSARAEEGAAVVKLRGTIQEGTDNGFSAFQSASSLAKRIRTLADKKEIKALLLDINSPGGTVAAVQDIYDAVLYFKSKSKPAVALMRDVAASGGFYIAMAADRVIAQPGTMTGSIGVILQASNFEGLLDKIGVKFVPIKSGRHKDIGAFYRPMSEEEAALLQEMIGETYQQFYNAVKTGRPNVSDTVLSIYADGRIFTGARAKTLGFIDDLGGEDKAREYLSDLTNIKDIKILHPRVNDFFDLLTLSASGLDGKLSLSKVEELATPKVSYLWTL